MRNSPHSFYIDPIKALLVLETADLLDETIPEESPLRRLGVSSDRLLEVSLALPVIWDSRNILPAHLDRVSKKGDLPEFIFVARKGARFDGHELVEQVLSSGNIFLGESASLTEFLNQNQRPDDWIEEVFAHPFLIKVRNCEFALRKTLEAASGIEDSQFTSVAVTGTNGKTSVTQILGDLLAAVTNQQILRLGTLGIQMGAEVSPGDYPTMPDFPGFLTALSAAAQKKISHVVMEATSHGLHQNRMGGWQVDVGIFTNLTQDHLDYHGTMEKYLRAKTLLFENHIKHGGTAVVNVDDPHWQKICTAAMHPQKDCMGYGSSANREKFFSFCAKEFASVRFLGLAQRLSLMSGIQGIWTLQNEKGMPTEANYSCSLVGDFQHENLTASCAALVALGYPLGQVANVIGHVKSIPGRLEPVRLDQGKKVSAAQNNLPTVLVDYAHSPDALEKALQTCRGVSGKKGKIICIFGCGGDRDAGKRPLMGEIAERLADLTVVTSDNPRTESADKIIQDILAGMKDHSKVTVEAHREKAILQTIAGSDSSDLILIAGKGHEDYQIIGTQKFPFSDVAVSLQALEQKAKTVRPSL